MNNETLLMEGLEIDESNSFNRELEQLYLEAEEYDFLKDITPNELPNYWEDED